MFQAILNVLAIIVLALAAGFIIILLVDLFLGCCDGKRGIIFFKNRKNTNIDNEILLQYNKDINTNDSYYLQNNQKSLTLNFDKEYEKENQAPQDNNIDFVKADEEEKMISQKNQEVLPQPSETANTEVNEDFTFINKISPEIEKEIEDEQNKDVESSDEAPVKTELNELSEDDDFGFFDENEEVDEDDEDDDDDKSIEEILKAIKERNMRARNHFLEQDDEPEFEDDEVVVDDEEKDEVVEKLEEISEQNLVPQNNEELDKLKALVEELNKKLEDEQKRNAEAEEKAKLEVLNLKQELANKAEIKEEVTVVKENVTIDTLNNLESELAKLLERQKQNEKDLKANKKEYVPLARIARTLESDEDKLRRREAIVAKKKMIILGVNNVADPEKLQKLDEDVDLLEGLKMSVAHCKEVMEANKDRYPVLKRTNEILVRSSEELAGDIKELQEKIAQTKQTLGIDGTDDGSNK